MEGDGLADGVRRGDVFEVAGVAFPNLGVAGFDAGQVNGFGAAAFFVLENQDGAVAAEGFNDVEPVFEALVGGGFVVFAGVVEEDVEGAARQKVAW